MAVIRVPYPKEPERRRAIFERALAKLGRYGTLEGTPDGGSFRGSVPIVGGFAGSYRSPAGSEEIEIEITQKPWLVSTARIESEARKFLAQA